MAKICTAAESSACFGLGFRRVRREDRPPDGTVGHAVIDAALLLLAESAATAFWVFTRSGRTALRVSKQRPAKPVFAFTPHRETLRYLSGLWGVTPLYIPMVRTTDQMIATAQRVIRSQGLAKSGQDVILLVGHAVASGATHIIKVHRVG
ncbi:MAG: hypothetical protein HY304_06265 [candidate division Zixibacteria bacterium]|nr:hypothetical protein [candidate division Zixibacteria bacterium]